GACASSAVRRCCAASAPRPRRCSSTCSSTCSAFQAWATCRPTAISATPCERACRSWIRPRRSGLPSTFALYDIIHSTATRTNTPYRVEYSQAESPASPAPGLTLGCLVAQPLDLRVQPPDQPRLLAEALGGESREVEHHLVPGLEIAEREVAQGGGGQGQHPRGHECL